MSTCTHSIAMDSIEWNAGRNEMDRDSVTEYTPNWRFEPVILVSYDPDHAKSIFGFEEMLQRAYLPRPSKCLLIIETAKEPRGVYRLEWSDNSRPAESRVFTRAIFDYEELFSYLDSRF